TFKEIMVVRQRNNTVNNDVEQRSPGKLTNEIQVQSDDKLSSAMSDHPTTGDGTCTPKRAYSLNRSLDRTTTPLCQNQYVSYPIDPSRLLCEIRPYRDTVHRGPPKALSEHSYHVIQKNHGGLDTAPPISPTSEKIHRAPSKNNLKSKIFYGIDYYLAARKKEVCRWKDGSGKCGLEFRCRPEHFGDGMGRPERSKLIRAEVLILWSARACNFELIQPEPSVLNGQMPGPIGVTIFRNFELAAITVRQSGATFDLVEGTEVDYENSECVDATSLARWSPRGPERACIETLQGSGTRDLGTRDLIGRRLIITHITSKVHIAQTALPLSHTTCTVCCEHILLHVAYNLLSHVQTHKLSTHHHECPTSECRVHPVFVFQCTNSGRRTGKPVESGFRSAEMTRGDVQSSVKWSGSTSTKSKPTKIQPTTPAPCPNPTVLAPLNAHRPTRTTPKKNIPLKSPRPEKQSRKILIQLGDLPTSVTMSKYVDHSATGNTRSIIGQTHSMASKFIVGQRSGTYDGSLSKTLYYTTTGLWTGESRTPVPDAQSTTNMCLNLAHNCGDARVAVRTSQELDVHSRQQNIPRNFHSLGQLIPSKIPTAYRGPIFGELVLADSTDYDVSVILRPNVTAYSPGIMDTFHCPSTANYFTTEANIISAPITDTENVTEWAFNIHIRE
ncbi:hypothetical protein CLF_111563, partial [Clonorchis sinensis]